LVYHEFDTLLGQTKHYKIGIWYLLKEKLNSDGNKIHQYQQNKQLHLFSND
jgi:hypothetical protein